MTSTCRSPPLPPSHLPDFRLSVANDQLPVKFIPKKQTMIPADTCSCDVMKVSQQKRHHQSPTVNDVNNVQSGNNNVKVSMDNKPRSRDDRCKQTTTTTTPSNKTETNPKHGGAVKKQNTKTETKVKENMKENRDSSQAKTNVVRETQCVKPAAPVVITQTASQSKITYSPGRQRRKLPEIPKPIDIKQRPIPGGDSNDVNATINQTKQTVPVTKPEVNKAIVNSTCKLEGRDVATSSQKSLPKPNSGREIEKELLNKKPSLSEENSERNLQKRDENTTATTAKRDVSSRKQQSKTSTLSNSAQIKISEIPASLIKSAQANHRRQKSSRGITTADDKQNNNNTRSCDTRNITDDTSTKATTQRDVLGTEKPESSVRSTSKRNTFTPDTKDDSTTKESQLHSNNDANKSPSKQKQVKPSSTDESTKKKQSPKTSASSKDQSGSPDPFSQLFDTDILIVSGNNRSVTSSVSSSPSLDSPHSSPKKLCDTTQNVILKNNVTATQEMNNSNVKSIDSKADERVSDNKENASDTRTKKNNVNKPETNGKSHSKVTSSKNKPAKLQSDLSAKPNPQSSKLKNNGVTKLTHYEKAETKTHDVIKPNINPDRETEKLPAEELANVAQDDKTKKRRSVSIKDDVICS